MSLCDYYLFHVCDVFIGCTSFVADKSRSLQSVWSPCHTGSISPLYPINNLTSTSTLASHSILTHALKGICESEKIDIIQCHSLIDISLPTIFDNFSIYSRFVNNCMRHYNVISYMCEIIKLFSIFFIGQYCVQNRSNAKRMILDFEAMLGQRPRR